MCDFGTMHTQRQSHFNICGSARSRNKSCRCIFGMIQIKLAQRLSRILQIFQQRTRLKNADMYAGQCRNKTHGIIQSKLDETSRLGHPKSRPGHPHLGSINRVGQFGTIKGGHIPTSTPASTHARSIASSNPSGNSANTTRLQPPSLSTLTTMGATASTPSATCAIPDKDAYFSTNASINSALIIHLSYKSFKGYSKLMRNTFSRKYTSR